MVEGDVFGMKRLMRLRGSQHLRDLCAETEFNRAQLIQPFFVVEGLAQEEPIAGLRGNVRHNVASALKQIEKDLAGGFGLRSGSAGTPLFLSRIDYG